MFQIPLCSRDLHAPETPMLQRHPCVSDPHAPEIHSGMGSRPSGSRPRPRPRPELPRPRRDRDVCQTVRDETETRPSSVRDETETRPFSGWDYIETHGLYMHGICTSHCVPKKESPRLGWKKQVNNKQSLILKIPKTFMFLFKWCVLQCFTQIPYCHYNLKTGRYKHRKGPKRTYLLTIHRKGGKK